MNPQEFAKPVRPKPKIQRTFPLRWRGYDRAAVDLYLRQLAGSYDRMQARLAFLEDLIGTWHEQGIDLAKTGSQARDFRFDPRAAYDLQARPDERAESQLLSENAPARRRLRGRPPFGFDDDPAIRWRLFAIMIGLVIMLAAIFFSRRASHVSALTSSVSPLVVAEPAQEIRHPWLERAAAERPDITFAGLPS